MPTQVFVSVTPKLRAFLSDECKADGAEEHAQEESIDLDDVYRLADEHCKSSGASVDIQDLLKDSEVTSRKVCADPREANLTEVELMRLQAEERKYQRMVDKVAPNTKKGKIEPASQGLKFASNFATQVGVAFIGAFLLGYFFVETFVSRDSFNAKVIAGAMCSFCTLLVETCLLVVHEQKETMINQKEEERAKKAKLQCRTDEYPNAVKPKADTEKAPPGRLPYIDAKGDVAPAEAPVEELAKQDTSAEGEARKRIPAQGKRYD